MARSVLLLGGPAGRGRDDGVDAHAGRTLRAALAEMLSMPLTRYAASTPKAPAATARTAPTTWPPMPPCWRAPCPAGRCACS
jgi:hypothetical protein